MKTPVKSVAWLLPFMLTACFHKTHPVAQTQPLAPPIVDTPPATPPPAPTDLPPPVVTVPSQTTASTTTPQVEAPEQPAKPKLHHKKPATKNAEEASNGTPGVSAIGQLSPGGPTDQQRQTNNLIVSTERGLNEITRKLNDQEQKTAAQIREFLKQARAALASGDVDGANTLALKAQVLLGEISK